MLRSALLVVLLCSFVAPARAWTRAHVRDANVELALEGADSVRVALELGVEVSGGWLERLEIPGLAALPDGAEHFEAVLTTEDGSELQPEVRLKQGVLELRLARAAGVRRGHHRLVVRYTLPVSAVTVAADRDRMRLEWTLPGWEAGLNSATIHWLVPEGSSARPSAELAEQVTSTAAGNRHTKISFARVHVPRDSSWQVAVEAPLHSLSVARAAAMGAPRPADWRARVFFALACAFVLALAAFARRHVRMRSVVEGWAVRSVWLSALGLPERTLYVVLAASLLSALAVALAPGMLTAALALLATACVLFVDRVDATPSAPSPRPFEAMGADGIHRQRRALRRERLGTGAVTDAGGLLGALGVVACAGALFLGAGGLQRPVVPWLLAISCSVVPLLAGARWRFPRSLAVRVRSLLRCAESLELQGVGLALIWRRDDRGGHDEARLRVFSGRPHHGLLRIDVMADSRGDRPGLLLCAVVLAGSGAARALQEEWSDATSLLSGSGKRVAFVKSTEDLQSDLGRLLGVLATHEQRSLDSLVKSSTDQATTRDAA